MTHAAGPRPVDPVDRAHLTGVSRPSPPIRRYAPSARLADLVDRYWIPVWSLSEPSTQSTLQHPVCLVVVSNTYARFYGVARGRSSVTLEGDGSAVGTMLTPAAGRLVLVRWVAEVTDRSIELGDVLPPEHAGLVEDVRAAMAAGPHDPGSHLAAIAATEARLGSYLPVDDQGLLVNRLVAWLRENPDVVRVGEMGGRTRDVRAQPATAGGAAPGAQPQVAGAATPAPRRRRGAQGRHEQPGRHGGRPRLHRTGALHPRLPDGDRHDAGGVPPGPGAGRHTTSRVTVTSVTVMPSPVSRAATGASSSALRGLRVPANQTTSSGRRLADPVARQ